MDHAIAGGAGGILALSVLYPLDNLRTRCQVENENLPCYEDIQNASVLKTTVGDLLRLVKAAKSRQQIEMTMAALPGIQAALDHQRDCLERAEKHPEAFPEIVEAMSPKRGKQTRTTLQIIVEVLKKEGILGFYKGLTSGLVGMHK